MSGWKKLAGAAAASADVVNAENVFSTYVYRGNSSTQTITNNIDLSTYGGLVWIKHRDSATQHRLFDTERGANVSLTTSDNSANDTLSGALTSFNSDGFTLGSHGNVNANTYDLVAWTFRKQERFFTIVTYTGNGNTSQTISHDLNATVGCMFVKCTSVADDWRVYHAGMGNTKMMALNSTGAAVTSSNHWNNTSPTSTHFTVGSNANVSGRTYVAYIWAHNNQGSGGFGATLDQDMVKCSTFNASFSGDVFVDLTFEPQWILTKKMNSSGPWHIVDAQRLWATGHDGVGQNEAVASILTANTTAAEFDGDIHEPWNRGFIRRDHHQYTDGGEKYIYIAIRRGLMSVPENASDVFALTKTMVNYNTNDDRHAFYSGWPVDSAFYTQVSVANSNSWYDRIRPYEFKVDEDGSPRTEDTYVQPFDKMKGWFEYGGSTVTNRITYMWRRSPQFYEVATWDGNSSAGRQITHTLGVVPEMMWVKNRDSNTDWAVYHKDLGNTKYLTMNRDYAAATATNYWNNTTPTASVFTLGNSGVVNYGNDSYIGYFFATLANISKVGSYTGNGSNGKVIDCGFTNGARFVLIKCTSSVGNWWVFDTARGINAGNDPMLKWDRDQAEINNSYDEIDYHSSGFIVNYSAGEVNISGEDYIFYAIA